MNYDWVPYLILCVTVLLILQAATLCLLANMVRFYNESRARERILRDRISDAQDQAKLLQEANRRLGVLLQFYERGRYQGDYQGEEADEILSAEYIGND